MSNLTSKSSFNKPVNPKLPHIDIIKEYEDVVEHSINKLSLANVAHNLKKGKKMYLDKVSKLQNNLGLLSQPIIGTGMSILSCLTCIIAVLALAMSLNVYCKMLVLANVVKPYELPAAMTEEPREYLTSTILQEYVTVLISILILCTVIAMAGFLYVFWKKSKQLFTQHVPHTTFSMTLFGNGDCYSISLLKTSIPLTELKLALPEEPQSFPPPRISFVFTRLHLAWWGLFLTSTDHVLQLPVTINIRLLKLYKVHKILSHLREIQLVASTLDEYAHLHTWFISTENSNPSLASDEFPHDIPNALPQEPMDSQ